MITNYNKEKFLKKSLYSVCNQNFNNYEIILFDDCSNDDSINIIKKYKKIKLIRNLKKSTKSPPLNQINGILQAYKKSKGEIICLMDSDDYFSKNKLKVISQIFQKNKNMSCIFNMPKSTKNQFNFKKKENDYSVWPTIFPTSCISFRRSFFLKFIKNLKKNKFPRLEIDARLTIFSMFFYKEYNVINKKLTFYSYDREGITADINKFSKLWWIRRFEAYCYLKFIMNKKKENFIVSFDYYLTKFLNSLFKLSA